MKRTITARYQRTIQLRQFEPVMLSVSSLMELSEKENKEKEKIFQDEMDFLTDFIDTEIEKLTEGNGF